MEKVNNSFFAINLTISYDPRMFAKKRKKNFPEGTFIPQPSRLLAILQLCIAFTLIGWCCSLPFMGDLFTAKSRMLVYQHVMGDPSLLHKLHPQKAEQQNAQLERNKLRFQNLDISTQQAIQQNYKNLQSQLNAPFLTKLQQSIKIFLWEIPPFELAWIVFTIVISIQLLLKVQGAVHAVWLLPLIAAVYAIHNYRQGIDSSNSPEALLFPTEAVIINDYLKKPLSNGIIEQEKELRHGWKLYLIQAWAHETPSEDEDTQKFELQAEEGEFLFDVALLDKMSERSLSDHSSTLHKKEPLVILLGYILWNLVFAWIVNRQLIIAQAEAPR